MVLSVWQELSLFMEISSVAAATVFAAALFAIRAADTFFTTFFGFVKIPCRPRYNGQDDGSYDYIFHKLHSYACMVAALVLSAYSDLIFRLVFRMSIPKMNAKTATAANPAIAAPTFNVAGAVSSVPMV